MKVLVKTFVRRCWFYVVEALELALTSVKLYIIKIVGEMVAIFLNSDAYR